MAGLSPPTENPSSLAQRLADDLARRWRQGEQPRAEDYLARHPELAEHPSAVLELLYEEICQRQEHGQAVALDEVAARFPEARPQLEVLLQCHRVLAPAVAGPVFPEAGEDVADFRLLAELGRGSLGRVFLAAQPSLADRPVVVKLVPFSGEEHLALARLQHTHIVPLYAIHDDPGRRLRVLCLPYFGGASLARLLDALRDRPPGQRTGHDILAALRRAQPAGVPPVKAPPYPELAQASYTQAVCWVGACLAEALHHAHRRGLLHLDLKPSNVLIAGDGQPMLLDFHLARPPLRPGEPAPAWLGGTPAYMPPEQHAALEAVRTRAPVPRAVDARADVYGLGLVLYEALGGTLPPPGRPGAALRRRNPQVSAGLADLLARCLAPDPADRYPSAAALGDDLRRHLADLPLRGVRNRSLAERWRKWRRRAPFASVILILLLAAGMAGGLLLYHFVQRRGEARADFREGQAALRRGEYGAARRDFEHALTLAEAVPLQGRFAAEVRAQLALAGRAEAAQELHRVAEYLRPLYGADGLPPALVRAADAHCRAFWERRRAVADQLLSQPAPELAQQVRTDMLDLALLGTDLRLRQAGTGEAAARARREALEVLDQAEALFGPSCVLDRERRECRAALGLAAPAPPSEPRPQTAWEEYALGRAALRAGDPDGAERHLERAIDLQPEALWPHFYRGQCFYRRGQYPEAAAEFTACVALAPDSAWCFHNRALALAAWGRSDDALRDADHALRLDPTLAAAALNRGMLHYRRREYAEALADLRRALDGGASPADVHYGLALVYLAQGDRPAAEEELGKALREAPAHPEARALRESLREGR